jgi:ferredoxin-NADP reductase
MSAAPQRSKPGPAPIDVIVSNIVPLNALVTRFEFARKDGKPFPPFSGGAHTVIEMHDGDILRRNPYSLMSDPANTAHYAISVRRDDNGRGGSLFMHSKVKVGDEMRLTYPVNLFPLDLRAKKQLFIAGGIGITPFLAQIKQLAKTGGAWELHYSVRSRDLASYVDELTAIHPYQTHIYYDEDKNFINLETLLAGQPLGTHVYICGPKGMIEWVHDTAAKMGWPDQNVHSEEFKAPDPGKPFEVTLKSTGATISVAETQSLLEAIEAAGIDAPFSCRAGACGQCETAVLQCDGSLVHNDHWLEDDEKTSGGKIMPCVSRFEGKTLIIDR